jgi:hypothetical protein
MRGGFEKMDEVNPGQELRVFADRREELELATVAR